MTSPHRDRVAHFRRLHENGCFIIPNPWDEGSAKYLRELGFLAVATTSAGYAFSRGRPDTDWAVTVDEMLAHIGQIVAAVPDVPVSADFESGYAHDPEGVAANVERCVAAGVAGLSIEDSTGDGASPLYPLDAAVARIRAARKALDRAGGGVLLTARAESFLVGHPRPLTDAVERLRAYAEADADVLYAPGTRTAQEIRTVVEAVAPGPVNVLVSRPLGLRYEDLAALGVRRISVGSALALSAWGAFRAAAQALAGGSFEAFGGNFPYAELNDFMRRTQPRPRDPRA